MTLEDEIKTLKIRKAKIFGEIEMLSSVNDSVYSRFGKTVAEIMRKEKQLARETNNDLDEN